MLIDDKLLQVIVCPKCKQSLTISDSEDKLHCKACKIAYPVKNNVPILLFEEAVEIKMS